MKIIVGGTFDKIHKGHRALLDKAIELATLYHGQLIVTVTMDYLSVFKSHPVRDYKDRVEDIKRYIKNKYYYFEPIFIPYSANWTEEMWKVFEGSESITLVCSEETYQGVKDVNRQLRDANKYNDEGETYYPVNVIIVPMVMAEDGKKISSTRIYNREINAEG